MDLFDDIIRDVMVQVTNLQSRTKNNGAMSIEGKLKAWCASLFVVLYKFNLFSFFFSIWFLLELFFRGGFLLFTSEKTSCLN